MVDPHRAAAPGHRLIALGASNLTRMLPTLIDVARQRGPVGVFAALGFGRSYGVRSHFLARSLPGIDGCGLWDALAAAPPIPPAATVGLLMDVGNDVLYGVAVDQIVAWVDRALARLRPQVDRLVVAGLPVHEVARIGPLRYGLVRTLLVPSCRVPRLEALRRAAHLHDQLRQRAAAHGAVFVEMRPEWYGVDPIHVRPRFHRALASQLLGADLAPGVGGGPPRRRAVDWLRVRRARARRRELFGIERVRAQPSARLSDGSLLSLD